MNRNAKLSAIVLDDFKLDSISHTGNKGFANLTSLDQDDQDAQNAVLLASGGQYMQHVHNDWSCFTFTDNKQDVLHSESRKKIRISKFHFTDLVEGASMIADNAESQHCDIGYDADAGGCVSDTTGVAHLQHTMSNHKEHSKGRIATKRMSGLLLDNADQQDQQVGSIGEALVESFGDGSLGVESFDNVGHDTKELSEIDLHDLERKWYDLGYQDAVSKLQEEDSKNERFTSAVIKMISDVGQSYYAKKGRDKNFVESVLAFTESLVKRLHVQFNKSFEKELLNAILSLGRIDRKMNIILKVSDGEAQKCQDVLAACSGAEFLDIKIVTDKDIGSGGFVINVDEDCSMEFDATVVDEMVERLLLQLRQVASQPA